ncbi:MAG TPA: 30S ribosomal protein S12 methylthiotransferase RimO [Bacteroidales bacterium]|nr:30S ribosomal protein S12 methylthiotransferase RimO [Bacteroidales bacterium]HPS17405.1 30S ribosomal protein S12 methylthiotransferase RimO [Bacteroidales bacterium]
MKTKSFSHIKINVITLGCSKNLVDSEVLLKQLDKNKFIVSHDSEKLEHDIVIINTCGFINDAKQESIETILQAVKNKKQGRIKKVLVTGCLSARYHDELKKEIPEVDAYFGVNDLKEILNYLDADYKKELIGERHLTTPSHYAYLKIAEGCDRKCSFCAIPLIRGKHISKPVKDIVKEATLLANKGAKELILIAQDLTYYGIDIYKKRKLAELLEKLSDIKNVEWIRLQYAYPAAFPMDVLKVMRERKNICNYLDIPFQHISDRLLKSMNRAIDKKGTLKLIEKIKKEVPGIALRTSLIVGYPGETEKDFKELMNFVNDVKFDRLGVFTYSHEESTKAYQLKDNISAKVKQERADALMKLQENISLEKNEALIGKILKVIIDRKENEFFVGRTEYDSPEVDNEVLIKAPGKSKIIGQLKNVKIIDAEPFDLFGEII